MRHPSSASSRMVGATLLLLLSLQLGCSGSSKHFRPERPDTRPAGEAEGRIYQLAPEKSVFGEALVWSRGAFMLRTDQGKAPVVHAAIQLKNTTRQQLRIDASALEVTLRMEDGTVSPMRPSRSADVTELFVPAHGKESFDFFFDLPQGNNPGDVERFDLRWRVLRGSEQFSALTSFVYDRRDVAPLPGYYIYDPYYFHRPYYFGSRFIVHHHHHRHKK